MNNKYVLHSNGVFQNKNEIWECKFRRAINCPFRLETSGENDEREIIWMYGLDTHKCDPDPIDIEIHKFKNLVKEKMKSDFRAKYTNVYNTTRKAILDGLSDPYYRELVSTELLSIVS